MRQLNPKVEQASGEYDRLKAKGYEPGIDHVARLFRIKPNALRNYRANYISRRFNEKNPENNTSGADRGNQP
jgi:hypothetical protein